MGPRVCNPRAYEQLSKVYLLGVSGGWVLAAAAGAWAGAADAVAAGNIFHYSEHSTRKAKEYMEREGLWVRQSDFYKVSMPRRPKYRPF